MKVTVDSELCLGSGICVEICPEVFELNGDAAIVRCDTVPAKYEEACRETVELCPLRAISVQE